MEGKVVFHMSEGIMYRDIYFFEVNTKYNSSQRMKISVNLQVRSTSEISNFFNT